MYPKFGKIILAFVNVMLLCVEQSMAGRQPQIGLLDLCGSAEVILVGRVESVATTDDKVRLRSRFNTEREYNISQATVTIMKVVKGELNGKNVVVSFPGPEIVTNKESGGDMAPPIDHESVIPGELDVVFLSRNEQQGGAYPLADNFKSVVRLADVPAVVQLLEGSNLTGKPEQQIASLLTASLKSFSGEKAARALWDLSGLHAKQAALEIREIVDQSRDPVVRETAMETLLSLRDYSRVEESVKFLFQSGSTNLDLASLEIRLSSRMACETNAEVIGKYYLPLLQHPDPRVRERFVYAVRRVRPRVAVPQLISGLQDSDQRVRYQCLMALSEMLERTHWGASIDTFEANESKYIGLWQTWWDNSGRNEFKDMPPQKATPKR
jgi:hypothetical protein